MNDASSSRPGEHALVSARDQLGLAAVRDEREPVAAEREVALVRLHRGRDDALGELQEPLVEAALEHGRPFVQVDDLAEHARVRVVEAERGEPVADRLLAHRLVGLDPGAAQRLRVRVRRGDLDLAGGEPVAVGDAARRDSFDVDGDRLGVELHAEPADRARKAQPARDPDHRLAEREPAHERLDLAGKRVAQVPARRR